MLQRGHAVLFRKFTRNFPVETAQNTANFPQSQVESTLFIKFMCEKLLPLNVWSLIGAGEEQPGTTQLRLLKVFAEMCGFCGTLEKPAEKVEAIYNVLLV